MGLIQVTLTDVDGLGIKLDQWAQLQSVFPQIALREATEIYNRGKSEGGTPVRTGELMGSLTIIGNDEVAYIKDYAPHVEYGHRTRGNGYVEGQRFFESNIEAQKPIYKEHLLEILEG